MIKYSGAEWIWIDKDAFPRNQRCRRNAFQGNAEGQDFTVVQFRRTISCHDVPKTATLLVGADTTYRLRVNGKTVATGPTSFGGDWIQEDDEHLHYIDPVAFAPDSKEIAIEADVALGPQRGNHFSAGAGGFYLDGVLVFEDGRETPIGTSGEWQARILREYSAPNYFDGRKEPTEWASACAVKPEAREAIANVRRNAEEVVAPVNAAALTVPARGEASQVFELDKIYSGYVAISCDGPCNVDVRLFEKDEGSVHGSEGMIFVGPTEYRGLFLQSAGGFRITATATGCKAVTIAPRFIFSAYPVEQEGSFRCSEPELDAVYDLCKWTLRICRHDMYLDSPLHQEPAACAGDYAIEMMMEAFTFGDMDIAASLSERIAMIVCLHGGKYFHTTYSLIWIMMLWDLAQFVRDADSCMFETADRGTLAILRRFEGYVGKSGLVETPPNYMFVDWASADGYSMHHPPKYLGQTVMNMFYYGALRAAEKLLARCAEYRAHDERRCRADISCLEDRLAENPPADGPEKIRKAVESLKRGADEDAAARKEDLAFARRAGRRARKLRKAILGNLYDSERGLFFDGLPTPSPEADVGQWLPQNRERRHYSRYSNVLAVLYGVVEGDEARDLLRRALDSDMEDVQPYFMHYVLNALHEAGLFGERGLDIIRRWIPLAKECGKGLKEGWFLPGDGYSFDYSHAWGGTPAYQLPARILGFEMTKPHFEEITLSPNLFGLEWADVEVPTPSGVLRVSLRRGEPPRVDAPDGLRVIVKSGAH